MEISKNAIAGTLESSDILVEVIAEKNQTGISVELTSSVYNQFGERIIEVAKQTALEMGVNNVKLKLNDHGALDCTIKARVETAILRAGKEVEK